MLPIYWLRSFRRRHVGSVSSPSLIFYSGFFPCSRALLKHFCIEDRVIQKRRQRSSLLLGGQNFFNSLMHKLGCTRTRMKSSLSSNHHGAIHHILRFVLVQNSQWDKEFNQFCPRSRSNDLCLLFCISPYSLNWSSASTVYVYWSGVCTYVGY